MPEIGDIVSDGWISKYDEGFSCPIYIWNNVEKEDVGLKINKFNQTGFKKPNGLFK